MGGSFNTARAAWPHMVDQGYGRIVMTTSTGMLGLPTNTSYATAKGGVVGLTRSLATAGAAHGIKVNMIAPGGDDPDGRARDPTTRGWRPELVAPMAAFLAHESCPVSGEIYTAGFGRFARLFIASTAGVRPRRRRNRPSRTWPRHWETINDETGYSVPADLMDWSAAFMAHLREDGAPPDL